MKPPNNNLLRQLQSFMTDVSANNSQTVLKKMQQSLDYLQEKIKIYEELLTEATGEDRPILSDKQKRRLAHAGKKLDDFSLFSVENTFSPETIRSWHRELVGRKTAARFVQRISVVPSQSVVRLSRPSFALQKAIRIGDIGDLPLIGIVPDPERRSNGDFAKAIKISIMDYPLQRIIRSSCCS